jgi:glycine/D-amino acid oxidase-like deaminating enzyme
MIYDWIIIGAGFTGSAVSYELAKKGFSVLLLEQNPTMDNATRYSYGGIPYWSGQTDVIKQIFAEGMQKYAQLSAELDAEIELRELDLLLTIDRSQNFQEIEQNFHNFSGNPRLLTPKEAHDLEPLLNPNMISGAITVKHGHVNPELLINAYQQAFLRLGGAIEIAQVTGIIRKKNSIKGVITNHQNTHQGLNTLVCAGGWSRKLLHDFGIQIPIYFTHAEMIEITPCDQQLNTLVMPANMARMKLEYTTTIPESDHLWNQPDQELINPVLEAGAVQFLNGTIRIGQISRFLSDINAEIDQNISEHNIRDMVNNILPNIGNLPGTWYKCLVAFSHDHLPLIGNFADIEGIQLFSGFSSPFIYVPILAQRFADFVCGTKDNFISCCSPQRKIKT